MDVGRVDAADYPPSQEQSERRKPARPHSLVVDLKRLTDVGQAEIVQEETTTISEQSQTATDLRLRAERARRLARGSADARAIEALNAYAEELEARVAAMRGDREDPSEKRP